MPDALDELRALAVEPSVEPESIEQLGQRVVRHRRRRRRARALASVVLIASIVAIVFVAVEERDANEVHTVGQPPSTTTNPTTTFAPLTNPLPFASQSVISSNVGIDLVSATGEVKRLYDKPTARAYALGDRLVVGQGAEPGDVAPRRSTGPILVFDRGGQRVLDLAGAEHLTLLDVGVVADAAVALASSRTGTGPQDTNDELLLIDLESGARTDLGSVGGWESGPVQGRLLADRVVLLQQASVTFSAESRRLDGGLQWRVDVTPPDSATSIAVVDDQLLLLHPGFGTEAQPMLAIRRLNIATGAELSSTSGFDLSPDPGLEIGGGFCFTAEWNGAQLVCDQSSGGPIVIDLSSRTTRLGSFMTGVPTVTRPATALKVLDRFAQTWDGTLVFLDDGSIRADGFNEWLATHPQPSAEAITRALLDITDGTITGGTGSRNTTIILTVDITGDDSVSGVRYEIMFSGQPAQFTSGTWGYRCARGNDTTSYVPRLCP